MNTKARGSAMTWSIGSEHQSKPHNQRTVVADGRARHRDPHAANKRKQAERLARVLRSRDRSPAQLPQQYLRAARRSSVPSRRHRDQLWRLLWTICHVQQTGPPIRQKSAGVSGVTTDLENSLTEPSV